MSQYYDRHLRGQTRDSFIRRHHTFSFGDFKSKFRDKFQSLNVINENHIYAGGTLKQEIPRSMDVLLYVLNGQLSYEDTLGHKATIPANCAQYIAADKSFHYTKSHEASDESTHYLEIWLDPKHDHNSPIFEPIDLGQELSYGGFTQLSELHKPSNDNHKNREKADLPIGLNRSNAGQKVTINIGKERAGFLHIVKGMIKLGGKKYHSGDSIAFDGANGSFWYRALQATEILLYESSHA